MAMKIAITSFKMADVLSAFGTAVSLHPDNQSIKLEYKIVLQEFYQMFANSLGDTT